MEGQGPPRTGPEIREGRGNYFLGGFGGKWPCPKASWVPYNPFPSHGSSSNPMGNHFLHKIMFSGPPFLSKKGPRPSRNPPGSKSGIPGSKNGFRGRKYQSCVLENHAECSGRYPKRSHMLQGMAKKYLGRGGAKSGGNVSADKTSVVSADKTSVVSANNISVVSADKTSAVSQDISMASTTQRLRPCVVGLVC